MCPNIDSLSKMTSHWKNKNWHNFWSRRDFDVFSKVIFFESASVEKIKLHAFSGLQYCFLLVSSQNVAKSTRIGNSLNFRIV